MKINATIKSTNCRAGYFKLKSILTGQNKGLLKLF